MTTSAIPTTTCHDCGQPTAGGYRCVNCRGKYLAGLALAESAERDRAILDMVTNEGLNGQRLANRLGISRTRARQKVLLAQRREAERAMTGV